MTCGSGVRVRAVIVGDGTTVDTQDTSGHQTGAGQTMRNIAIVGNTFRNGQGYDDPIVLYGEPSGGILNAVVADNAIDSSTSSQNGIRAYYVSRLTVTGNTVNNVAGTGISTEQLTQAQITGNVVYNPGAHGITVVSCTYTSANSNSIRSPGGDGILVQGGSDIGLLSNDIQAPGQSANATYYGIRVSTSAADVTIAGNRTRTAASGNQAIYGLSITSGCTARRYGNDLRPGTGAWTSGALNDGASSNTTATDITS
jgi:hypothetical protein